MISFDRLAFAPVIVVKVKLNGEAINRAAQTKPIVVSPSKPLTLQFSF